jgi:hypothetical protein
MEVGHFHNIPVHEKSTMRFCSPRRGEVAEHSALNGGLLPQFCSRESPRTSGLGCVEYNLVLVRRSRLDRGKSRDQRCCERGEDCGHEVIGFFVLHRGGGC